MKSYEKRRGEETTYDPVAQNKITDRQVNDNRCYLHNAAMRCGNLIIPNYS